MHIMVLITIFLRLLNSYSIKILLTSMFQTPACDLKSLLAVGLKRMILQELSNGCPTHANNPIKQKEILDQYSQYLSAVS